jgi:hypothetical protein
MAVLFFLNRTDEESSFRESRDNYCFCSMAVLFFLNRTDEESTMFPFSAITIAMEVNFGVPVSTVKGLNAAKC